MSSPCCGQGSLHEGTPVGRVETVHGLPTYVSEPPENADPKAFVVMIPDAFGWDFVNLRLLADNYAKRSGARVYMPEFMDGNSLDPGVMAIVDRAMSKSPSWTDFFITKVPSILRAMTHFLPFLYRTRDAVAGPRVRGWFSDFRQHEAAGGKKVAATGYCWGGKYVTLFCALDANAANGEPLIDCGFTAHPSNLVVPDDINRVERPLSISVGDNDLAMGAANIKETKKILEQDKPSGVHEVVILPGAKHGFSVRGHPGDKKEMEQAQIAEDQAINWFHKHMGTNA